MSVDSVTLNSVWQTGLPWMRLNTENMPLLASDQLRVEKPIEDEVRVECYDDAMTSVGHVLIFLLSFCFFSFSIKKEIFVLFHFLKTIT